MAAARKRFTRSKSEHLGQPPTEPFEYACFMADLLGGAVQASALHEQRAGQRFQRIDYDDPDG